MIKVIYGAKGTGKTKLMIDAANEAVKEAKGHLIYITDSKRYMYDLEREVRFIDTSEYDVAGEAALCGFVKGVIAGNNDNEYVYIDGVVRIAGKPVQEMAAFFYMLDKVSKMNNLVITVSVSADKEELPDFVTKYL
jgi:chromosomal replication initiation ATPase DnaA